MDEGGRRWGSPDLLQPTIAPVAGKRSSSLLQEAGYRLEGAQCTFSNGSRGIKDITDSYAQVDWTPWDCCRCAAETRDAMLENVANAFGRYALIVYKHPKKFIIFSALLCLGLSVGLVFKQSTTDGVVQYTIPQSQAQKDADEFRMLFQGNVTRSEVILIASNDGQSNLLEASFLNAVWDMHMRILDLKVTNEGDRDGLAEAAVAVAEIGDTLELPKRRLQESQESSLYPADLQTGMALRVEGMIEEERGAPQMQPRSLAWGDPAAAVQQHFVQQQLRQQHNQQQLLLPPQWPMTGGGRRRREAYAAAAAAAQAQEQHVLGLPQETETVCDPEKELPRVRITGLGCRQPLGPGEYGFQNLCHKDSTGACEAPDGVIFVYTHRREFGSMLEYPLHTSFLLARAFPTDMLLSRSGLRLTPSGRYATATAALSIRYQISDDAKLRPYALRWERKLQELLQQERLPGAHMGLKTERSLSDELAASSSAGPGGEAVLVAAAGSLIGMYVWVVNFSRSHLRSKATVALTGAGAALLGYLGGAGMCFMCGVVSTGTAAAAPLLVVGIGVDDTLVLLQSYSLTVHKRSAADRLQLTLRDSGVGITITTLTNLLTFGIGAFSPYLAIQSFCLLCLAGLFLGYVMCLTFFLGFLALDARAEAAGRVMAIFRCFPMEIMRDSAPTKTADPAAAQWQQHQEGHRKQGKPMRTIKGLPTLQYVDRTRLPGADASAFSACASDIFQCITMQVEAALQRQQQQRLIEAETRRMRKQQTSKKKQRKEATRKRKKAVNASITSTASEFEGKDRDKGCSESDSFKPKRPPRARTRKQPPRKSAMQRKKTATASRSKNGSSSSSRKEKNGSIKSSRSSSKRMQKQQRQKKAKALRPALKGRRQKAQQEQSAKEGADQEHHVGSKEMPPGNSKTTGEPSEKNLNSKDLKTTGVSVRLVRPRRTTVHFYRKTSTVPPTADGVQKLQQQQLQQSRQLDDDWKDQMVVNLCMGSGSAVVAAAAEAAEAAFNTTGRSWSGERIARLQLLQRLGSDGIAEPQGNVGRGLRKVLVHFGARLLMNPFFKLMLLVTFAAVLVSAIIGCFKITAGLDPRSLTKDGTMLKKFFDMQEKYFGTYGDPVMVFFSHPENVCSAAFRVEYQKLHERLKQRSYTMEMQDGLFLFLQSPLARNVPEQSATTCMQMLYAWLQTPFGSSFTTFFSWSSGFRLRAWALVLVPKYFSSTQENSNFMHQLRADLAQFPMLRGAAYNRNFVYFESDDAILPQTVSSLATAGCAVIVVSLFLLPSLRGALLVVFVLLIIDIVILGFMALWGLPLNLLTMVNLTISIGFSVDYATHTTHAFCHCMGQKRGLRAFEAVLLVGGPLLHGALSTQLAVVPLAFVDSPVLSVFFKMTTLVIIVGVTHGLMLLPVLLSLIGPLQQSQQKVVQQLLALQKQYQQIEEQIVACGGSRANPRLRKQRRAIRRLIEQQEQPAETARDACFEFLKGLCPNHPKNVFLKSRYVRRWVMSK
ncbi:Lipid/sterol:H+ symporter, related [Eimeria necatrix]|uniref:Lipid/sterol:H+ symporter, related n=1 Tax=Eimeria necatrix TaxID=51315 RepID=U6N1V4_9EIME|nr:Lipid/sterol:H+ symporter, related [Eimeria necatrix]CDJ69283.1 Lipid/sterol:H+ symporter, related [Eimeria necatrix]